MKLRWVYRAVEWGVRGYVLKRKKFLQYLDDDGQWKDVPSVTEED